MKGAIIRDIRKQRGRSQDWLARKLGIDRSAIAYHEARGSWPEDLLIPTSEALDAPELLMIGDSPLNPVWLGYVDDPLEGICWLREEIREVLAVLDSHEQAIRKGESAPGRHEEFTVEVYDLVTAVGCYVVSMARHFSVDVSRVHIKHKEKVAAYIRRAKEAVA